MIRPATLNDVDTLEKLYADAKLYLRSVGNNVQWTGEYPNRQSVIDDITNDRLYVCQYDDVIAGAFALCPGIEPTYNYIEGAWKYDDEYRTIHRVVSAHTHPRVGRACIDWCQSNFDNLRIDTHQCNKPMLRVIEQMGFVYSGIVYMADNTPRMAFEWKKPTHYDVADVVLNTEKVVLRPWKPTDLQDFYNYAQHKEVGPNAGWLPHTSITTTEAILNSFIKNGDVLAIYHKQDDKVMGSVGIHPCKWSCHYIELAGTRVKELGYVLSKDYHNCGLMSDCIRKVLRYCFGTLGLDAVTATCFDHNIASRRVMEHNGMVFLDQVSEYVSTLDKQMTVLRHYITKEQYFGK